MNVEEVKEHDLLIFRLKEKRLDAKVAVDFKQKLSEAVDNGSKNLVLNLSEVTFIDSSGLGAIVSVLKKLGREGNLFLVGLNSNVINMFKLTRMDRVFRLFNSETEAVTEISK